MACHSSVIQTRKRPRKVAAPERLRRPLVARVMKYLACQSRLVATTVRLYTKTARRSNRSTTLVLRVGHFIEILFGHIFRSLLLYPNHSSVNVLHL